MKASELLRLYDSFTRKNGWERIHRSNIINDVDPSAFNYSMEEPIMRRFGGFFNIMSPWVFSAVQPCIRTGDFGRLKSDSRDQSHLTLFHIMPTPFRLEPDQNQFSQWHCDGIVKPLHFLTEIIGLDIRRIRLSYFGGGTLREISSGRIPSDEAFRPDQDTIDACLDYGMSKQQMLPDSSSDTFLCVSPVAGAFYAGYRYEFFYQMPADYLLEIGTGEALEWKQRIEDGRVVGIEKMSGSVFVTALGLERCLFAVNENRTISECDHIQSVIDMVSNAKTSLNKRDIFLFVDALRAVHMVAADGGNYSGLNKHLREQFRQLMKRVTSIAEKAGLAPSIIREALIQNALAQSWIPELVTGVDIALREIESYRGRQ